MKAILALLGDFQASALFEHIVYPPHGPHALGEVRIEVAVVDGIAGYPVAVARTAVGDFIGVAGTRADALGIHVVGVVVIGVEQPLVAVQVKDVLFVTVVAVTEFDEVTDVTVVDVRRLGWVQRHRGLDAHLIGRWHLPRHHALQADVGWNVHQHGDVADGMGAEEELFIGARQAVMHRPHAQAIGDDFGTDAARTVVDHERVAGRFKHVRHHRVRPVAGERLGDRGFVVEHGGEITERFEPVRDRRVALANTFQRVGRGREAAVGIGPQDDGIGFAGNDLIAVDHAQDRRVGLAFGNPGLALREAALVVDDRLPAGRTARAGQAHFFFGDDVAVGLATLGHDHYLGEQAVGDVAGGTLAAERGAVAGSGKGAFALGEQVIGAALARSQEEVAIAPGVGRDVLDTGERLHTVDHETHMTVGDLGVDCMFAGIRALVMVGVGLVGQQVLQVDAKAIAGGDTQHHRPRALVRAQADLARYGGPALGQRHIVLIDHVAAQGVDHAVDVLRTEAVEHQGLVQHHHIGHQVSLTARSGLGLIVEECIHTQHGHGHEAQVSDGRSMSLTSHVIVSGGHCATAMNGKTTLARRMPYLFSFKFNELNLVFRKCIGVLPNNPHLSGALPFAPKAGAAGHARSKRRIGGQPLQGAIGAQHLGHITLGFTERRDHSAAAQHRVGAGVVGGQRQGHVVVEHHHQALEVARSALDIGSRVQHVLDPQFTRGVGHQLHQASGTLLRTGLGVVARFGLDDRV
ncbi:hypothetical protein D9M71_153200 [compost metagenome]